MRIKLKKNVNRKINQLIKLIKLYNNYMINLKSEFNAKYEIINKQINKIPLFFELNEELLYIKIDIELNKIMQAGFDRLVN